MQSLLQRWYAPWEQFWFQAADPTRLGLIRIGCGLIVVYTMVAYSFHLDEFLGEHAWLELNTRMQAVRYAPIYDLTWNGSLSPLTLPVPRDQQQKDYLRNYLELFGQLPPAPYPRDAEEGAYCNEFRQNFGFDLRLYGLPPPTSPDERRFVEQFALAFKQPPAPPYPRDAEEKAAIFSSMANNGIDPHRIVARGQAVFSLWFYITDPVQMRWLHAAVLVVSVMFLIGLCTRITTALTWFFFLNYLHRAPNIFFGADTMTAIVLLYLMIGPSGAALSVDRLLARRWSRGCPERPLPSVSANLALRLLQVHLCIIYLIAGLAKLHGSSWWNGTAVWGSFAHFEMAPITNPLYLGTLRLLAENAAVFYTFLFLGTYFTLAFEICYPFMIWLPSCRRWLLGLAFLLHGLIGVVMGLRSFSLLMLVMNLAFLKDRAPPQVNR